MGFKNIDDEIAWWKTKSDNASRPELQMLCWAIGAGLKIAKVDYALPAPTVWECEERP